MSVDEGRFDEGEPEWGEEGADEIDMSDPDGYCVPRSYSNSVCSNKCRN